MPILLFLYPKETPSSITSITLTVAFFNALSGSIAYSRLKRIDYRSGLLFATTAVPGAIIGAFIVNYLNRSHVPVYFRSSASGYLGLSAGAPGKEADRPFPIEMADSPAPH